ncbi:hypothetical protein CUJ83_12655 [Methanocella sp. CWC-04]|uniref:Uncharacterized protein n=1 Tax=Methanooceanicella nereidis TaxID=2052831 RepID=A0AAP2RDW8_9EURY|nr:hypothetical protein [Methanocella sp. CWC-04]MCD1295846.1 hypothetical protein [Methanocella sp. CWC-04]
MDKFVVSLSIISMILVAGLAGIIMTDKKPHEIYTPDHAVLVAKNFVMNDETYKFDGIPDTLNVYYWDTLRMPYTYAIAAEFTSAHGGYGDRTGVPVTQALTHHNARIIVSKGKVISAIMDSRWDMINEKPIQYTE